MREQAAKFPFLVDCRYTITDNEWTCPSFATASIKSIHSHIQWWNRKAWLYADKEGDTPSHIMRKLQLGQAVTAAARYTLTYSEGTLTSRPNSFRLTIHPHIQWGNTQYLRGFQPLQIPCCEIYTKAFCHPRHIFNMPKNARSDYFCGFFYTYFFALQKKEEPKALPYTKYTSNTT